MKIEEIWLELEREAERGNPPAWLMRFASPKPTQQLLVALETSCIRRTLLLPIPLCDIPPKHDWPECKGLDVFSVSLDGAPHLGVRLRTAEYADVFAALAEDVASRVSCSPTAASAADALLARLRRWQKFLSLGTGGLSPERQRGLFGELHTLRSHFLTEFGPNVSVSAWRAPTAAHQDFQLATGSVEVKSTAAKQPQSVRITSERQLDDTGIPALFLHVVILDERVIEIGKKTQGETLPDMVEIIRTLLKDNQFAADLFDERLLDSGYLQIDAPRYEGQRFSIRKEQSFHVHEDFPRLVEKDLPNGLGDVSYALSLSACEAYAIDSENMLVALRGGV